jgi:hypothetical protein
MAIKKIRFYVDLIEKSPTQETLQDVARLLFDEVSQRMKVRSANTNKEAITVLDIVDRKWQTICRRLPDLKLNKDGFRIMVLKTYPSLRPYLQHWLKPKGD